MTTWPPQRDKRKERKQEMQKELTGKNRVGGNFTLAFKMC